MSFIRAAEAINVRKMESVLSGQTSVECKVLIDLPDIDGMQKEDELKGLGYSFGHTGFNNESQKALGTIRVETMLVYAAYLDPPSLYAIMHKHRQRKEEKMLNIVRSLPYFKGITRNTALKVSQLLEKQRPVLN